MKVGDRYFLRSTPEIEAEITKIEPATALTHAMVEYCFWNSIDNFSHKTISSMPAIDFLAYYEPIKQMAKAPDHEPTKTTCECGGSKIGYKDYTKQHSTWCPVYKGE